VTPGRATRTLAAATALAAVVCVVTAQSPAGAPSSRRDLLRQGLGLGESEPLRAADLLERAGPGATLEMVRQRAWLECLERSQAAPELWQRYREQRPPAELAQRAALGLGRALLAAGEMAAAVTLLEGQAGAGSSEADELLVGCPLQGARERAARRLAVRAPQRLRELSAAAEGPALAALSDAEWLQRSAAWRAASQPRRAVDEIGRQRWRGERERERRLELARAHLDAGSPRRALQVLPSGRGVDPETSVLRAAAYRQVGWQRFPAASAGKAFATCLEAALTAAESDGASDDQRRRAWALAVECATESQDPELGLEAWRDLARVGWEDERKEWLGRRLGLALADRAGGTRGAAEVGSGLPSHARCLRYWSAPGGRRRTVLRELAAAALADVYGQWARAELGIDAPAVVALPAAVGAAPPPRSVQTLLDWGLGDEGARQWLWTLRTRGATPAEAVAAAEMESAHGHRGTAVSVLRAALPELGTVAMASSPEDAVKAYLPLHWERELLAAARESGLEPWLVAGVARQESLFDPRACSPRGAMGLLQLLPSTARGHALSLGLGAAPDLYDPALNLRLGARELARLVRRFGALEPALAAYNAGEGRASRWWKERPERRAFTEAIPIPETYSYVRRVMFLAEAYRLVHAPLWRVEP